MCDLETWYRREKKNHRKFFKINLRLIKIEKRHFTPELENISSFFSAKKFWPIGRNFYMYGQKADFAVFQKETNPGTDSKIRDSSSEWPNRPKHFLETGWSGIKQTFFILFDEI